MRVYIIIRRLLAMIKRASELVGISFSGSHQYHATSTTRPIHAVYWTCSLERRPGCVSRGVLLGMAGGRCGFVRGGLLRRLHVQSLLQLGTEALDGAALLSVPFVKSRVMSLVYVEMPC